MNKVCKEWCENLITRFDLVTTLEGKNHTARVLTLIAKDYQKKNKSYDAFKNDLEIDSLKGFDHYSAKGLWAKAINI